MFYQKIHKEFSHDSCNAIELWSFHLPYFFQRNKYKSYNLASPGGITNRQLIAQDYNKKINVLQYILMSYKQGWAAARKPRVRLGEILIL